MEFDDIPSGILDDLPEKIFEDFDEMPVGWFEDPEEMPVGENFDYDEWLEKQMGEMPLVPRNPIICVRILFQF